VKGLSSWIVWCELTATSLSCVGGVEDTLARSSPDRMLLIGDDISAVRVSEALLLSVGRACNAHQQINK
jgi:hypothetical protein